MTDADKQLLLSACKCLEQAETTECEVIYMEIIIDVLSMYTTKEKK